MTTVNRSDLATAVNTLEMKGSSVVDFGGIFRFFEMISAGFTAIGKIVSNILGIQSVEEKTKALLDRIIEVLEKGDDALLQFRTLYKKLPKHIQEAYHTNIVSEALIFFKSEQAKLVCK